MRAKSEQCPMDFWLDELLRRRIRSTAVSPIHPDIVENRRRFDASAAKFSNSVQ
jgi:hypothetical protein